MKLKVASGIILTLLLMVMLTLALDVDVTTDKPLNEEHPSIYVGIAKYYDNRKCVVTSTHDDLARNKTGWHLLLSMLTEKKIYHTGATVPSRADWEYIQYWIDKGYLEAGSHSRNHPYPPYVDTRIETKYSFGTINPISCEYQIGGSKQDIIGNLTLSDWFKSGENQYVYSWIEPHGAIDDKIREMLGDTYYLSDRGYTRIYNQSYVYNKFAEWDDENGLFERVGYTIELYSQSVNKLNEGFDEIYENGLIYHFMTHPGQHSLGVINLSKGSNIDLHTDYIANRTDVWYVPFGLLYLYHWVDVRNVTDVTSVGHGQNKIFKITISETDHLNYGVSYPITYVFDIPPNWKNGYVYYRYQDTDRWKLMDHKDLGEFFNGIETARFNFTEHKAYVSIGFSNSSHDIYLKLRHYTGYGQRQLQWGHRSIRRGYPSLVWDSTPESDHLNTSIDVDYNIDTLNSGKSGRIRKNHYKHR